MVIYRGDELVRTLRNAIIRYTTPAITITTTTTAGILTLINDVRCFTFRATVVSTGKAPAYRASKHLNASIL